MSKLNHIQIIYKRFRSYLNHPKDSGFTLLELLMAIAVSSIVVYAMLSLVVSLLETEKRETAKTQTQIEIGQAMDYIASEIEQAAYIYEGPCLGVGRDSDGNPANGDESCPGLSNFITFPDGLTPVLAFWKLETVPYNTPTNSNEALPEKCSSMPLVSQEECYGIKNSRSSYTLVVYGIRTDTNDTSWDGPARITRYQLRKYKSDELKNLTKTPEYLANNQDPQTTGFQKWPCTGRPCSITKITQYNDDVLVDLIDDDKDSSTGGTQEICSKSNYANTTYSLSPAANTPDGFYACVSSPGGSGGYQDAVIFIRGNAAARAGEANSRKDVYLPSISRRVKAGTLLDRKPPEISE
jgi:prepilin-type N-terminal cleavage/methylation domain-containing protein